MAVRICAVEDIKPGKAIRVKIGEDCLLYTSDAADE